MTPPCPRCNGLGLRDQPTVLPTWAGGKAPRKEPCPCPEGDWWRACRAGPEAVKVYSARINARINAPAAVAAPTLIAAE